jgi:hypothetical protein
MGGAPFVHTNLGTKIHAKSLICNEKKHKLLKFNLALNNL